MNEKFTTEQYPDLDKAAKLASSVLDRGGWRGDTFDQTVEIASIVGEAGYPLNYISLRGERSKEKHDLLSFTVTTGYTNDGRALSASATYDVQPRGATVEFSGTHTSAGEGYDPSKADNDNLLAMLALADEYCC